jgi:hypothetical protein
MASDWQEDPRWEKYRERVEDLMLELENMDYLTVTGNGVST